MSAVDLASQAEGATVVSASSYDMRHPPENIIDGHDFTFWCTTGGFPQEVVIKLKDMTGVSIQTITTVTTNGKRIPALFVRVCCCRRCCARARNMEN